MAKYKKAHKKKNIQITTREFLREFAKLVKKPKSKRYTIVRYGKVIGTFIPHTEDDDWWDYFDEANYPEMHTDQSKSTITLKDLRNAKFKSGNGKTNLSQQIDEIVYGVKP